MTPSTSRSGLWCQLAGGLLACAFGFFSTVAQADEPAIAAPSIKGFGTLGLARSDQDNAEFVRDLSQPRGLQSNWSSRADSILGVQANYQFGPDTEAVVQAISRYRSNGSHQPEVSLAFLKHDFSPDFQVRGGRLGTEFYMLADSRMIGYSNTTVRPPADFYGPLVFSYFDGVDVSGSTSFGNGLLRAKLYAGHSPERTGFYDPLTWDLAGSRLLGGHLDYFVGPWQFRVAHTAAKFSSHELPLNFLANAAIATDPALAGLAPIVPVDITTLIPELSTVGTTSRFDSLGLVYDKGPLQVQAMIGRIAHESEAYEDSRAGFVLASYRVGQFTPFVGYSKVRSSASQVTTTPPVLGPFGPGVNQLGQALTKATHTDQHTVTLGTRWDFRQNWALKAQLDSIRGTPQSLFLFRGPAPAWNGRMKVFSVALDFAF
jgi:hypothetical protein